MPQIPPSATGNFIPPMEKQVNVNTIEIDDLRQTFQALISDENYRQHLTDKGIDIRGKEDRVLEVWEETFRLWEDPLVSYNWNYSFTTGSNPSLYIHMIPAGVPVSDFVVDEERNIAETYRPDVKAYRLLDLAVYAIDAWDNISDDLFDSLRQPGELVNAVRTFDRYAISGAVIRNYFDTLYNLADYVPVLLFNPKYREELDRGNRKQLLKNYIKDYLASKGFAREDSPQF